MHCSCKLQSSITRILLLWSMYHTEVLVLDFNVFNWFPGSFSTSKRSAKRSRRSWRPPASSVRSGRRGGRRSGRCKPPSFLCSTCSCNVLYCRFKYKILHKLFFTRDTAAMVTLTLTFFHSWLFSILWCPVLLCICQKQCCCMLKKCLSTFVARAQFGESGLYGRINYTCNPNALKPKPNQRQENHHYQLSTISSLVFVRKNWEALELSSGPVFSAIGTVAGFSEPRCLWSNFFMS